MTKPVKLSQGNHITIYIWERNLTDRSRKSVGHAALEYSHNGKSEYFSLWPKLKEGQTLDFDISLCHWEPSTEATSYNCQLSPDYKSDTENEGERDKDGRLIRNTNRQVSHPHNADHTIIFYNVHFDLLLNQITLLKSMATKTTSSASSSSASSSSTSSSSTGETELRWVKNKNHLFYNHHSCASSVFFLLGDFLVDAPTLPNEGHNYFDKWKIEDYYTPNGLLTMLEQAKLNERAIHSKDTDQFDKNLGGDIPTPKPAPSCTML